MDSPKSVLILSQEILFAKGVEGLCNESNAYGEVFTVCSYKDFEIVLHAKIPDVIVIDLSAKAFKLEKVVAFVGFTTQSKIVVFGSDLVLSECDKMRSWGVDGILQKSSSEETMMKCLQVILEQGHYLCRTVKEISEEKKGSNEIFEKLKISERETEIIKLIAEGFINKEIADKLFLSTHTVNTHRKNIMHKLGINNTAGIVLFAVQQGIVSPNEFLFN